MGDIQQPSGVIQWLATGGLIVLIGLVSAMWRRQTTMNDSVLLIRGALIGYEGQGGLMSRLQFVEENCRTVDERIRLNGKHAARNEMVEVIEELDRSHTKRMDDHETRLRALEHPVARAG